MYTRRRNRVIGSAFTFWLRVGLSATSRSHWRRLIAGLGATIALFVAPPCQANANNSSPSGNPVIIPGQPHHRYSPPAPHPAPITPTMIPHVNMLQLSHGLGPT